ncbi:MAG: CbiX/SirB N-terminal domain-containing protein [Acidobacteriota bacterium]
MDSARHYNNVETTVIIFTHGSAVEAAKEGVHALKRRNQQSGSYLYVWASFLGPGQPELGPAIAEAAEAGFERIVIIPYFLSLGTHLHRDLPRLVAAEKQKHPHMQIQVGRSLEDHPEMALLVLSRIQELTKEVKVSP